MEELQITKAISDWLNNIGVPSSIFGCLMWLLNWKIQKKLDAMEEKRKKEDEEKEKRAIEREKGREELIMMQLQSAEAAIALSKATAKAVQRIPDAKCNGDMTRALEYVSRVQDDQKEFLFKKGIHSLYDDED